jgi:hypothetical protein
MSAATPEPAPQSTGAESGTAKRLNMDSRLTRLEARLDSLLPTLATRSDVAESKSAIIIWLSGAIIAATAIIITTFGLMLSRAMPVTQSAQPYGPVIVYPSGVMPSEGREKTR